MDLSCTWPTSVINFASEAGSSAKAWLPATVNFNLSVTWTDAVAHYLDNGVFLPGQTLAACGVAAFGVLLFVILLLRWIYSLKTQLEHSNEESKSLAELFSSEMERLRTQLAMSREDSASLDGLLGSILQGGLPAHLEMRSVDFWCVKTMRVTYTTHDDKRRTWRQSGYHLSCFVPGGATGIEVTFGAVGGQCAYKVDRTTEELPWVVDDSGARQIEQFVFPKCPGLIRFEMSGPSLHPCVSAVKELSPDALTYQDDSGKPRKRSCDLTGLSSET